MKTIIIVLLMSITLSGKAQCKAQYDSLRAVNNVIAHKLFVDEYKLERIKFYLHICMRSPKQDKWLKGWILRSIK